MIAFPALARRALAFSLGGGERPDTLGCRVSKAGTKQKYFSPLLPNLRFALG
jgi:hypothetical protein